MKNMKNIGIYPGSFNPFHRGHYDIFKKAEAIFDHVIIARGTNPFKTNVDLYPMPKILDNKNIMQFDGLLTDFIKELPFENITVIRGLRNASDLSYEITQYRYLQHFMPDIKVVSIFCAAEYEHISSSAIKALKAYGKESEFLLD